MLPIAAEAGLSRVLLTCDDDNVPSRKVIEANGGSFVEQVPIPERPGHSKLHFWVPAPRLVSTPTIP
jgi:predicted acetyltransferase